MCGIYPGSADWYSRLTVEKKAAAAPFLRFLNSELRPFKENISVTLSDRSNSIIMRCCLAISTSDNKKQKSASRVLYI